MVDINPTIPIITLNVNGINISIKRHRSSERIRKPRPNYMLSTINHFEYKNKYYIPVFSSGFTLPCMHTHSHTLAKIEQRMNYFLFSI